MPGKYHTEIIDGRKVVVDENGKPCRACNTLTDFRSLVQGGGGSSSTAGMFSGFAAMAGDKKAVDSARADPPDVAQLGRHTWTFLHSLAAYYPKKPTPEERNDMNEFIRTFAEFYPCQMCAEDFRQYIKTHSPAVGSRDELSMWFCQAHNDVNKKLMKPTFDCSTWRKRWLDGWE